MHHVTYIAGLKFRPGAAERATGLPEDHELQLEPEPTNRYDPNAVKVCDGDFHLGYVPRDLAAEVGDLIATGRFLRCVKKRSNIIEIHYEEPKNA